MTEENEPTTMSRVQELEAELAEAREHQTNEIEKVADQVRTLETCCDGSADMIRDLAELRSTLGELESWHASNIESIEERLSAAHEDEHQASQDEDLGTFGELLKRETYLAEQKKAVRAGVKIAQRILDNAIPWGFAPPSVPPHVVSRLEEAVTSQHGAKRRGAVWEAYKVATEPVRGQRLNNRLRARVAKVPAHHAVLLPIESLGDDEGLAAIVEAEKVLRLAANTLADGIARVKELRLREAQQREDREDDLRAEAQRLCSIEQRAKEQEVREQLMSSNPEMYALKNGKFKPYVEEELERRVRAELGPWYLKGGERVAARLSELRGV